MLNGNSEPEVLDFVSLVKRIPELEVDRAIADVGGAKDLYEKMFRLVLRLMPQNISQMEENLYTNGDLGAFAIKAHSTRGSLNQIGNKLLGTYAEKLENAAKAGDKKFCDENYGDFKNKIVSFCSQAEAIISEGDGQTPTGQDETMQNADIAKLLNSLEKAKEAIEDFDSISALDILSPFAKRRFGAEEGKLLSAAIAALESFDLQTALEHISKLQDECAKV